MNKSMYVCMYMCVYVHVWVHACMYVHLLIAQKPTMFAENLCQV